MTEDIKSHLAILEGTRRAIKEEAELLDQGLAIALKKMAKGEKIDPFIFITATEMLGKLLEAVREVVGLAPIPGHSERVANMAEIKRLVFELREIINGENANRDITTVH